MHLDGAPQALPCATYLQCSCRTVDVPSGLVSGLRTAACMRDHGGVQDARHRAQLSSEDRI